MSIPKTPLFGLSAHGTIGKSLTHQKRGNRTIARSMPTPHDPRSLAQVYQRWDYQDYAAMWQLQSPANKQLYETNARRQRITGFNLWMRQYLNTLPDLAARFHLDNIVTNQVRDSSKNSNHATLFGSTLAPGIIDNALFFDGLDDYTQAPDSPSLRLVNDLTIEAFVYPLSINPWGTIVTKLQAWSQGYWLSFHAGSFKLTYYSTAGTIEDIDGSPFTATIGRWNHMAVTKAGTDVRFYIDGLLVNAKNATVPTIQTGNRHFRLGFQDSHAGKLHGYLDEVRVSPRTLQPTEILRHSQRRYP